MKTSTRKKLLLGMFAGLIALALLVAGWFVADVFQSPAQREAAAKPPAPTAITARVVRGGLAKTVSARATVERESTRTLAVASRGDASVITKAPIAVGSQIGAGSLVLEVDGRPTFAIPGSFAFYRDLSPGMEGPDVSQLQAGLNAAGLDVSADGSFGSSTERAIRALYAKNGYIAPQQAAAEAPEAGTTPNGSGSAGGTPSVGTSPTSVLKIPRQDFMVIAGLPAFARAIPPVGTPITADTTLTVEEGATVAVAKVAASAAAELAEGTTVAINHSGKSVVGKVASVTEETPAPAQSGDTKNAAAADMVVKITTRADQPLDPSWLHQDVLAEFQIRIIADSALIVPSRAVSASADGTSRVLKRETDGSFVEVRVQETGSLDGRSAVAPITPGDLDSGDLVKVG